MSILTTLRGSATRGRRLARRSSRRVLAALFGVAILLAIASVTPASAVVANNGQNRAWANQNGCTVVVGDQASPRGWAIGELDVGRCSTSHTITVWVELALSGSSQMTNPYYFSPSQRTVYSNYNYTATGAICGGAGYWQTIGYVSWDNGSWIGPYSSKIGYYRPGAC